MQKAIKRFGILLAGCFLVFVLYLFYLMMIRGPALSRDQANPRPWILENRVIRGGIYGRGGEKLAESIVQGEQIYRQYPYGSLYAHLIGYRSRRLGKTGLEYTFDRELLGLKGSLLKSLEVRWGVKDIRGNDLYLTIDHRLQEKAQDLLAPYSGAAVVLDPRTGEILAMVSTPGFDPDPERLDDNWEEIRKDPGHPLMNRATMGLYPPGSTQKIVTAAAGLKNIPGLVSDIYDCYGEIKIRGRILKDTRAHGEVDLKRALAVSCNSYFAGLGLRLGAADFAGGLADFGWGESIDLDFPVQTIPLPRDSIAGPNGLAEASIGQGKIVVNPLFMAMVAGSIGNDGIMMKPYLVKEIRSSTGDVLRRTEPQILRKTVPPEIAANIRDGMVEVVRSGTGGAASLPGIKVAGKTGSAENPAGAPHAWFVAFAPDQEPRVAVSVLVEHGGQGGRVAAPIARELIKLVLTQEGF